MTEHESLAAALAAFQAELPSVHKGATGQVPGKRTHRYADLADMSATVLPLLGRHGLSWMAMPTLNDAGVLVLRYELLHTSGQSRIGDFPLTGNTAWEIGSSLTYARRYCLSAVTGVAADDDDDGHAAQNAQRPTPAARRDPADEARQRLRAACEENGWDLAVVATRYVDQHYPMSLRGETDHSRIDRFRESLFAVSDAELKSTEAAA